MPLIFKLRDNDIVDSRSELEQSIINNLAVFFDGLPPKFIYKILIVASITTKDGSNIKGASHQVLQSTSKTGIKKYKTVYNKWAVMDISVKTDGGVVRKLERIVLAPVNILTYNPTLGDLETQSNSVNVLVQSGGLKLADYQLQNTTVAPPAASAPASGTVPAVTNNGTPNQSVPAPTGAGQDASTLTAWYQAQGQKLPSLAERAKLYESLTLGPAGVYVGSGEQNITLLTALKKQNGLFDTKPAASAATGAKLLGSTQFYKTVVNGSDIFTTLEWGGNVPFGYTPISATEYINGVKAKIKKSDDLHAQYSVILNRNGGTLYYTPQGESYVGSDILDAPSVAALQKQVSDIQSGSGIFAPNYRSADFSKFKPDAPTPSEQYYTALYFASLPPREQARLKASFPTSY